ncbi:hypothetical protein ABN763_18240 [Spongiivirga sp. MCCC 1A20706]|uniref:DUF6973 domain-containing protein n=1 Tax=Spongiivirga sp. MCCC 1A20706 TaxID=3160963 RepID=UPI00397770B3
MSIRQLIRSLSFKQLWGLTLLFIRRPLLLYPTAHATRVTYSICNKKFGKKHHKNGQANAFRHAVWNVLIIVKCLKWNSNKIKCMAWAKRITDWHEDFAPNEPLARAMDLHNNNIGRQVFADFYKKEGKNVTEKVIEQLTIMTKSAIFITEMNQIKPDLKALVYIEND